MIRLARHIEILLLGNECVIVPNLGGFVAHRVSAHYDSDEELFLPPQRTLGFTPQLKMNDSLLAQSYAEAYDLSFPEAVDAIENEVRELLRIMGNNGSYELTNLGRLYYDKDGRMNFEPDESGVLTPEFYALSSFEMPLKKKSVEPVAEPVAVETDTNSNGKPKVIYIGSEHGRKTLNISLKVIRNTSVAAVVIATVFFVSYPLSKYKGNTQNGNIESGFYEMFFPKNANSNDKPTATFGVNSEAKTKPASTQNAVNSAEKTSENSTEVKQNTAVEAPSKDDASNAESTDNSQSTSSWSIVVCSHVTRSNAEALTSKLHKEGYSDAYVSESGAVKVLYGHFDSKNEALKKLNELNSGEYFKDAWLLEVKK